MIKIRAHHGSPGSPEDFLNIKSILRDVNIDTPNRFSHENKNTKKVKKYHDVEIGYSFGCYYALKNAVSNKAKILILISPYLFTQKISHFKSTLLNMPLLGRTLITKAGPKALKKMIEESYYPYDIDQRYEESILKLFSTATLKNSIFEKNISDQETITLLNQIKSLNIKVIIINGKEDKTSKHDKQIKPIEKILGNNLKVHSIKNAGHAITWSNPNQVAEIISNELLYLSDEKENNNKNKLGYHEGKHILNNVYSFLEKHLKTNPEKKILSWVSPEKFQKWDKSLTSPLPHDSITVKELAHMVNIIGKGFLDIGIKSGDRVIIFIPMSLYLYASMFALQKIGAIPVFLDSWARRDQMGLSAKVASPKEIISVEQAFQYLKGIEEIDDISIKIVAGKSLEKYDASLDELMKTHEYAKTQPVEKEHTALITFTTGSSGVPKGADRSHRFLAAQHYALHRHLPYELNDMDLPVFPIFSLNNLAEGVTTIIPAIDLARPSDNDAFLLIAQMKTENVSCTTLSPSLLNKVSSFCIENNLKLTFLRRIITGGAPVSKDDVQKIKSVCPNAEILVLYGSTEVEPMAHIEAKEMLNQVDKSETDNELVDEGVNVGKMDKGLDVKFIKINKSQILINNNEDWKNYEVEKGEVGEIIVSGEHVCQGYYNNTEAFKRAKIKDANGTIWHRTGDLGRYDESNNLWLVGRVHNAINRNGDYQFPVRAEIILKKLNFVKLAAFLGMKDDTLGEKTYAVITLKDEFKEQSHDKFLNETKRILNKNNVITDEVLIIDSIPMDPRHHSKVEYEVLKKNLTK